MEKNWIRGPPPRPAESPLQTAVREGLFFVGRLCFFPSGCATPQKSNIDTKIAIFKGSYLFQTIILGIHVSFRGCNIDVE